MNDEIRKQITTLIEDVIDELIESRNGLDDLSETTNKSFLLRDLLEELGVTKYE